MFKILRFLGRIKDLPKDYHFSTFDNNHYSLISSPGNFKIYYIYPDFVPTHPTVVTPNSFSFQSQTFNDTLYIDNNIDIIFNINQYSDTELLMIFGKKLTDEKLYGDDSYIIINYLEGL